MRTALTNVCYRGKSGNHADGSLRPALTQSRHHLDALQTGPQILLDEMFFVSGEIPRVTSYEKGFPFHLAGGDEKIIAESVRDIGAFGLRLIAPSHCTGWRAVNALVTAYGESVVARLAVGKIFEI